MAMFNKVKHSIIHREPLLSSKRFVDEYKTPAKPVVLTELSKTWPARSKWSFDYLCEVAGDSIVPVYSSAKATGNQHQHAPAINITLREYLKLLNNGEKDLRLFFYNILNGAPALLKDFTYPEIGLKFFRRLPVLFAGGKGAKVQMHYDIDLADLLLCHFGGRKHVLLIPPEQTKYLYKVPFSFSALHEIDLANPDFNRFPALQELDAQVTVLNHGDVLYIPSGFWHYIIYEEAGFSMTLRAMPQSFKRRLAMLNNVFVTRLVEGFMRRAIGQKWNDRNERLAIVYTHQALLKEAKLKL
ncbi:MAG: hypothetical protein ACI9XU_001000 [Arenicella sp.]|jgi:hypothetical protein